MISNTKDTETRDIEVGGTYYSPRFDDFSTITSIYNNSSEFIVQTYDESGSCGSCIHFFRSTKLCVPKDWEYLGNVFSQQPKVGKVDSALCKCPTFDLVNFGCKCGGK